MAKYAVMLNADVDDVGAAANGLEYALDLDDADHRVRVYLDGSATQWAALLADEPDHPVAKYYREVRERGLLAGACGYCADAFDVYEEVDESGVDLLGDRDAHGPDVAELVADGYELVTVG